MPLPLEMDLNVSKNCFVQSDQNKMSGYCFQIPGNFEQKDKLLVKNDGNQNYVEKITSNRLVNLKIMIYEYLTPYNLDSTANVIF